MGNVGASSKVVSSTGCSVGVVSSSKSELMGARYLLLEVVVVSLGLKSGCWGSVMRQYLRPSLLSAKIWRWCG